MKTELLKIAQDLEQGTITDKEARTLLLGLLGVSNMLRRLKNHAEIYGYPSESFKTKMKKFIRNYC